MEEILRVWNVPALDSSPTSIVAPPLQHLPNKVGEQYVSPPFLPLRVFSSLDVAVNNEHRYSVSQSLRQRPQCCAFAYGTLSYARLWYYGSITFYPGMNYSLAMVMARLDVARTHWHGI
jgi:hypothetical protein